MCTPLIDINADREKTDIISEFELVDGAEYYCAMVSESFFNDLSCLLRLSYAVDQNKPVIVFLGRDFTLPGSVKKNVVRRGGSVFGG